MKKLKLMVVIVILFAIYSCAKNESTYTVREVNGIRITENTGVPADSTFNVVLREIAIIENDPENDPERSFRQASSVDISDNGYIFVLDRSIFKVLIYDKEGKFVNSFGGQGQGPGEFINPGTVNVRQDTVFVTDFQGFKIHTFDTGGNFIRSRQVGDMHNFPFTPSKFGEKYITSGGVKSTVSEDGRQMTVIEVSLFDSVFDFIKNLHLIEYERPGPETEFDPTEKGVKAAASDINAYVYEHSKTQYKIDVYDINGDKIREIRKPHVRISTPQEVKDRVRESGERFGRRQRQDYYNSIFNLYADKYNRLWVTRPTRHAEEGHYFDVFENDIFINRVKLDIDGMPIFAGDKIVVWSWKENQLRVYDY